MSSPITLLLFTYLLMHIAGPYYPSPLMGSIIGGTLINSLGAFVPFDKGVLHLHVLFVFVNPASWILGISLSNFCNDCIQFS